MAFKFKAFDDSPRVAFDGTDLGLVATNCGSSYSGGTFSSSSISNLMLTMAAVTRMGIAVGKIWEE